MIFEKIAEQEKELIDEYIQSYGGDNLELTNSLDYRLRYWNRNKKDLFELFGQQLILKKTVSIEKPSEQVADEMVHIELDLKSVFRYGLMNIHGEMEMDKNVLGLLDDESLMSNIYLGKTFQIYDLTIHNGCNVIDSILEIAKRFEITIPSDFIEIHSDLLEREKNLRYLGRCLAKAFLRGLSPLEVIFYKHIPREIMSSESLVDNIYSGETFYLPSGLKIQKGSKTMKALLKIAKEFGITIDPDIISKHSEILNQKKITGNLCLSIHPLDFLTMSDNDCGWRSCFAVRGEGEYRATTISLMNSPLTVIAYLESSTPMDIPNGSWNNKKWREVFVINKDIMSGVKGYPYKDEILEDIVLQWLKELSPVKFSEPKYIDVNYSSQEEEYVCYKTETDCAYNDFFDLTRTVTSDTFISGSEICFMGESVCIACGGESIDEPDLIACNSCLDIRYCPICGDRRMNHNSIKFDGEYYCGPCFDNAFSQGQTCKDD